MDFSNQIGVSSFSLWEGEAQAIKRAKKGEAQAFGELYDHYGPQIYRFVFLKVSDKEEAEDLTHQVFLKAYESMPSYEERGYPFSSWLYRIARNRITDHYRTKRSDVSIESFDPEMFVATASVSDMLDSAFTMDKVKSAIANLKPDYQDVIIMRFVEELSLQEVAEALDKSVGAVKLIQHRALQSLRKNLPNGFA